MVGTNDFQSWAEGSPGANLMALATYIASTDRQNGVSAGIADQTLYNRAARQAAVVAKCIGDFVAGTGGNFLDDGNDANRVTALIAALKATTVGSETINPQTGTSYAILTASQGTLITHSNAAAIADTIAQAGSTGFPAGWWVDLQVLGSSAGSVTLTPTTSTIDGGATIVIVPGQGVRVISDGTNYQVIWFGQTIFRRQVSAPFVSLGNAGASLAINFASGVNFTTTANTSSWTLANPTNTLSGQAGSIELVQDGTGSRVITFGTNFIFPGGVKPILSTAAASRDILSYLVMIDGKIASTLNKAYS